MQSNRERPHRGTIQLESATVEQHVHVKDGQHILTLRAPNIAEQASPGSFIHVQVHALVALRRPMSIMRSDKRNGTIEVLYKSVGFGTQALSERCIGEELSVLGPIGNGFSVNESRARPLLIGGGVGIPPLIFLAEHLKESFATLDPLVFMGSEVQFPFDPRPSNIMLDGIPPGVIGCVPLLDDWGIPSRLASGRGFPGCYEGFVTDLADTWLATLDPQTREQIEIYSCGPTPMLQAVAKLARKYDLPSQLSLEEYMACAVGGCAGCVVEVFSNKTSAMKRVCVDGPVFEGQSIFPG
jgi:dihydroorotate dehydrogenase electron transfer subunit